MRGRAEALTVPGVHGAQRLGQQGLDRLTHQRALGDAEHGLGHGVRRPDEAIVVDDHRGVGTESEELLEHTAHYAAWPGLMGDGRLLGGRFRRQLGHDGLVSRGEQGDLPSMP